eukprot:3064073-Prymnesium_polylepis.1
MQHIFTNWKFSNCGGAARGFAPWLPGGVEDTDTTTALIQVPVNGFAPEVQIASKGFEFDWDTMGGREIFNSSLVIAGTGAHEMYAMQYMWNWEDADGSFVQRPGRANVMAPARAGSWWRLDNHPGSCEIKEHWKLPMQLCDKGNRHLGSMFTVVMTADNQQDSTGSA